MRDQETYVSIPDDELDAWAARVRAWRRGLCPSERCWGSRCAAARGGRDVFVYFDNDAKVHAPFDAIRLADRLHARGHDLFPSSAAPTV